MTDRGALVGMLARLTEGEEVVHDAPDSIQFVTRALARLEERESDKDPKAETEPPAAVAEVAEEPDVLTLEMLPKSDLTDRASVRAFVQSDRFHALLRALRYMMFTARRPTPAAQRDAGAAGCYLLSDLDQLVAAAVDESDRPLRVQERHNAFEPAGYARRLGAIVRILGLDAEVANGDILAPLYDLIDYHNARFDDEEARS